MIVTVFGYTVIDGTYYKNAADTQQKKIDKNPVSRGNILSSNETLGWVLAVSTNLWTLAIDPTQTGSQDALMVFLSDIIFSEFCSHDMLSCRESMSLYLRDDLTENGKLTEWVLKNMIQSYLKWKISEPITSVLLASNLPESTIESIIRENHEEIFFISNNLYVNPNKVQNPELLALELWNILQMEPEILKTKFKIRKKQHLEIIRKMSIWTRDMVNKRITTEKMAVKNGQMDSKNSIYQFIKIEDNLVRYYPEWETISQITGFVDSEGRWRYGIEWYFENDLQIESPIQTVIKDTAWRPIRDYVSENSLTLKSWVDITLTIDRNIQKEISRRAEEARQRYRANRVSVIVMNPKTGWVVAMVNAPSFDANDFTDVYDMELVSYAIYPKPEIDLLWYPLYVIDSMSGTLLANIEWKRLKLRSATEEEVSNYAIMKYKFKNWFGDGNYKNDVIWSLYEPWSVFKAFSVAIGIDTGEISPDDTYYDRGYVELDVWWRKPIKISNASKTCIGRHTFLHSLNWSCNVWMITIVEKIWKSLFAQYLVDFWFNNKSNITTDGEVYAQIPPYEKWPRAQFFNMSFGQGISVTMLQMAAAYSVLANWWVYMQPYIIESMRYPDGKEIETVPTPLRRVIKESTSKQITAMLVDGVRNGFAREWWVPWYTLAWKTGTSQIPWRGGYEPGWAWHTITSFWGYGPASNPKFVLIVRVDRPRNSEWSEFSSSPLWQEIAKYLLEYYKVPKNN
jgi:cell division protein FtsI/penicillin-binding protein 2